MTDEPDQIVYVIDDDAGIRQSLLMLAESASLTAIAFSSAEAFLDQLEPDSSGCIVLDLRMPGMGGIELLERLRSESNDMPVILISGHAEVPETVRGMKLGAVDLLQKPVEPSLLIETIRRSLELGQTLRRNRQLVLSVRRRFERLTAREMELLTFVVDGHANKRIAVDMGISIKTVANHRASLMLKTEAANAADLGRLYTLMTSMGDAVPARDLAN